MTLKEFLDTLPDDEEIAVGAASGYFYLGSKSHFLEKEGYLSTRLLQDLVDSKNRAKLDVQYICQVGVAPKKEARRNNGKDLPAETMEEYIQRINDTAKRLSYLLRRVELRNTAIARFKPLITREVKRSDKKQIYGGLQIIVSGNEAGKFWLKEEYDEWETTGKYPSNMGGVLNDAVAKTDP